MALGLTGAVVWLAFATSGAPSTDPAIERSLISLEAQTHALREVLEPNPRDVIELQLHRARVVWNSDPAATAALFNLVLQNTTSGDQRNQALIDAARDPDPASVQFNMVLRRAINDDERTLLLIEAARAEASIGYLQAAMKHYLEAIAIGRRGHQIAAAFEGFVAVAERSGTVPAVPSVDRYVEALSHEGELDVVGWETVYRLGRLLIRRGDRRVVDVVTAIPEHVPAGRRGLYILATEHLRRGQRELAKEVFERAANLPPYPPEVDLDPERDRAVRELVWLAIGRLAFEDGDKETGIVAYHQISVDSPRFLEAFYELGWLAMEAGDENVAREAFRPVVELGANTAYGRKAQLLRGYMLLQEGRLDEAEQHYEKITETFQDSLRTFAVELAKVEDLGDLARDCDTRERALEDPFLQPVLARDGVRAARKMALKLAEIGTLGFVLDNQLAELDALLAGEGALNPLGQVAKDRRAIERVLQQVDEVSLLIDRRSARHRWLAGPAADAGTVDCCGEPRHRAANLRNTLETFIAELDAREQTLRSELTDIRDETVRLQAEQRALYAGLVNEVSDFQIDAVAQAAAEERGHLKRMLMEGEAGVLESIWQRKERNLQSIMEALDARKILLERLQDRYREILIETM